MHAFVYIQTKKKIHIFINKYIPLKKFYKSEKKYVK